MRLHAVTLDRNDNVRQLEQWVHVSRTVDRLHVRLTGKDGADIYNTVKQLLAMGAEKEKLIVHDRLDVALLLGLSAVHLGFRSPPVAAVRRRFPQLTIGASVHSLSEAVGAVRDGADYVLYGHVFETRSKPGIPPKGLSQLQKVVQSVDVPVVAIGGITLSRLSAVASTGVQGVAVRSGIFEAESPSDAAAALKEKIIEVAR